MDKAISRPFILVLVVADRSNTHICSQGKQSVGRFILQVRCTCGLGLLDSRFSLHLVPTFCLVSTATSVPGCGATWDPTAIYTPRSRLGHYIVFLLVSDFSGLSSCMGR